MGGDRVFMPQYFVEAGLEGLGRACIRLAKGTNTGGMWWEGSPGITQIEHDSFKLS